MNCHDVKKTLSVYIDGMLPEKEASTVKDHLARCTDCMGEYESMLAIVQHMNKMETVDAPAEFLERVDARLEKRFPFRSWLRHLFVPLRVKLPLELAGVAAAVVLLVYVFGVRDSRVLYEVTISLPGERGSTIVAPGERGEKRDRTKRGDKKGGEKHPHLEDVIGAAGWRIVSIDRRDNTDIPMSMIVEIPADEYQELLGELNRIGVIQKTPSRVNEKNKELIEIRITIQRPDSL